MPHPCAFCGREVKLTKEHVWADSFYDVFPLADKTWMQTHPDPRRRVSDERPRLKDLCADCNNGTSDIDEAARDFARRYLTAPIRPGVTVEFSELVRRWAAKAVANIQRDADRKAGRAPSTWWRPLIPFIFGNEAAPANFDLLFASWHPLDAPPNFELLANRTGAHNGWAAESAGLLVMPGAVIDCRPDLAGAWAMKFGSGVFAAYLWRATSERRRLLVHKALEYDWVPAVGVRTIHRPAFSVISSRLFSVISSPDLPPAVLREALAGEPH